MLSHAFSAQGLRDQEARIHYFVDILISRLASHSTPSTKKSLDLGSWFNWKTFGLIGDLAFGESFGCLETTRMHPWIESLFANLKTAVTITSLKRNKLGFLLPLVISKRLLYARAENYRYSSEQVEKRVKYDKDRGDFLDCALKHGNPEKAIDEVTAKGMTMEEFKPNAFSLVLGGSETTATLLSGMVFQLLCNPRALERAAKEIREKFASIQEITFASTAQLSYMLAVLDEAMRVYPPVPILPGRIVPEGGDTVDGVTIVTKAVTIATREQG